MKYNLELEQEEAEELLCLLTSVVGTMQRTGNVNNHPRKFLLINTVRMQLRSQVEPGSVISETMEIKGDGG